MDMDSHLNVEKITGTLHEKRLQKFRIEKVIYDNSFNSWIDKKDAI